VSSRSTTREATVWTPSSFCWVGVAPDADPETVDLNDPCAACSCVGAFHPRASWLPTLAARDEHYDFRGTEAEARWLAAKKEIAANIADSGWPTEYDPAGGAAPELKADG
jgi:hypothetical protein